MNISKWNSSKQCTSTDHFYKFAVWTAAQRLEQRWIRYIDNTRRETVLCFRNFQCWCRRDRLWVVYTCHNVSWCALKHTRYDTYQGLVRTISSTKSCVNTASTIWPIKGVKTFRETRSAVGRFRDNTGKGSFHPTRVSVSSLIPKSLFYAKPTKNCNWQDEGQVDV